MKHLVHIAALGCLVSCCAVLGLRSWMEARERAEADSCESSLSRLRQIIKRHAGLGDEKLTGRGWPKTIQPEWFEGEAPRNPFLTGTRPWIEVASENEALLTHPPIRYDMNGAAAEFWYNPFLGIVRARVPYLRSDRETLALYNDVNDSALGTLLAPPPTSNAETMAVVESGVVEDDPR